jgi:hypothetical protein
MLVVDVPNQVQQQGLSLHRHGSGGGGGGEVKTNFPLRFQLFALFPRVVQATRRVTRARSSILANIRAMKKLGTALELARRAAFKSVLGQR